MRSWYTVTIYHAYPERALFQLHRCLRCMVRFCNKTECWTSGKYSWCYHCLEKWVWFHRQIWRWMFSPSYIDIDSRLLKDWAIKRVRIVSKFNTLQVVIIGFDKRNKDWKFVWTFSTHDFRWIEKKTKTKKAHEEREAAKQKHKSTSTGGLFTIFPQKFFVIDGFSIFQGRIDEL